MLTPRDVILGVLLPACLAAAVLLAGSMLRGRWAGVVTPIAIATAFVTAHVALLKLPRLPPLDSTEWLFHAAAVLGVIAAGDSLVHRHEVRLPASVSTLRAAAVLGICAFLVWLIARPMLVFQWTGMQGMLWLAGIALVMWLVWISQDLLIVRTSNASPIIAMSLLAGIAGAVIAMSGSQKLGQIGGIFAAATGGAAAVGLLAPRAARSRGAMLLLAPLYVGLIVSASEHLYARLSTVNAALLLGAPLFGWGAQVLPAQARNGWIGGVVRVTLALIPAMVAATLAWVEFRRAAADYWNY